MATVEPVVNLDTEGLEAVDGIEDEEVVGDPDAEAEARKSEVWKLRSLTGSDCTARRRQRVAELRLRGLTQREIVQRLREEGIVNLGTRRPYSLGTINADLQALDREWREEAQQDMASHKGRLLAEGREVRRVAWEQGELRLVRRGIDQEAAILGIRGAKLTAGKRAVRRGSEGTTSSETTGAQGGWPRECRGPSG